MTALLILAVLFGFYVAWNIGANDVANAVGPAVGSGALTLKQAVLIAAVFEFCGAFFLGSNVSETIEAGVVNPQLFSHDTADYVYGMLGSLLAAGVWLQIASFFGWPVSTTHSIVGAVVGFGLVFGGFGAIDWGVVGTITLSWIFSPIMGGILGYLLFSIIRKQILYSSHPLRAAKKATPVLVFFLFFILSLIILFGGLKNLQFSLNLPEVVGVAFVVGGVAAVITWLLARRIREDGTAGEPKPNMQVVIGLAKAEKHLTRVEAASLGELHDGAKEALKRVQSLSATLGGEERQLTHADYRIVERIFMYLLIITACFMAFAHGSNDVANAIGPLSAIFNVLRGHNILDPHSVPMWLLLLGGAGIVIGLATWGWRVIETVGRKITELTPSRAFAVGFSGAVTICLASKLGLPISTTHVIVGAVLGVGFARGIGALNLNTIRDIVISWIITVPAGALLSVVFFYALKAIF